MWNPFTAYIENFKKFCGCVIGVFMIYFFEELCCRGNPPQAENPASRIPIKSPPGEAQFVERKNGMLNFEEELAKFKPSRDIDQVEDTIVNRDITDVTDIMVQFLKEQLEQDSRE